MAFGSPEIHVEVKPDGTTTVEGKNFPDNSCLKATASLKEAMGKATKTTLKPEGTKVPDLKEKVKIGR
jgi:hypothetical protein